MAHETIQVGDLTAVIGDNEAHGEHRAGYNGIHSLVHRAEPENVFVPTVAGLNLEHYFDGEQELRDLDTTRKVFFEPRNHPMTLEKIGDDAVQLHQAPTPTFHVESWTRFKLVPPHYVDFSFTMRPTQHVFRHGYVGVFWASYVNGPEDKSIYFRGNGQWLQHCTPVHNRDSTVLHRDDKTELRFAPNTGNALFKNVGPLRFDEPFYYGHIKNQVLILMFASVAGLRFAHSPSGGGFHKERQTSNPAWDFQFIVPKYEVLQDYQLRGRLVYRPRCTRDEILQEYARWQDVRGK